MRKSILLAVAVSAMMASAGQAAVVVGYDFGVGTTGSLAASTVDAHASASAVAASPAVSGQSTATVGTSISIGYASQPTLVVARTTTASGNVAANVYFSFTVTAAAGYELDLSSLTFDAARGGASEPRTYNIKTSVDNYATSVTGDVALGTVRPNFTAQTVDLSGSQFQNLSTITFHVHIWTPGGNQNIDIDNLNLNGAVSEVSAVPEPAGLGLVAAGALGVLARRRGSRGN